MLLSLERKSLKNTVLWQQAGIEIFTFHDEEMIAETTKRPQWIHFGPGNIFRAFIASLQQTLLNKGKVNTGIIAVAPYDNEVIENIYRPHDNLSLLVTMNVDDSIEKQVIGSISESLVCHSKYADDWARLKVVMQEPSLQIASFTITEKGYKIKDFSGVYSQDVQYDVQHGLKAPKSFMGRIAALLYLRYQTGQYPLALLSLDNCSNNGQKLKDALIDIVKLWISNGFVEKGFYDYLNCHEKVAFPCSMIDKITPRPSVKVKNLLEESGFKSTEFLCTKRNSYYAPFVNAEKTEYLVIEDDFPNGRMPLEEAGVIFTDLETVDKVEKMKVCTCLNPLHTALAIFGCLLGYTLISDEMKNPLLRKLVEQIGYVEGMPVVINPGVLEPEKFMKEVIEVRFPNPNILDTPQRIASDTSQKIGIRFGETIKAYVQNKELDASCLNYIPLVIAGWCRYLIGLDDRGKQFVLSPDPLLTQLQDQLKEVEFGQPKSLKEQLKPILSNQELFGSDLYQVGLGVKIENYVKEMLNGVGAVEQTLEKYVHKNNLEK
ncbi:MAG: Mannitol 2-dehydrogenase [Firmicutes bacterium]|nr:Mannitol 2-dehydrogenase [Bacillota bacterium]